MAKIKNKSQEEQFKDWVREYSDSLYHHSLIRGFDADVAKDLVQDTFLSAWKGINHFEGKSSVKNWLFVILKNKINDQFRKSLSQSNVLISDYDGHFDETGHWAKAAYPKELTIDPEDLSANVEFEKIMQRCSSKLNRIHKAVFFMKYLEDLESEAICLQLSISLNNYWTILHRAKVQLRSCLERNWLLNRSL